MADATASARRVARDLVRAWNAHDLDAAVRLHAPHYAGLNVAEPGPVLGEEAVRRGLGAYFVAFPDLAFAVEDTIAHGDRVVLVWCARGTHRGRLMNIPPTGRPIDVHGVSVLTVERGRLTRGLHVWDVAGLLRALRLLPELS